MNEKMTNPTQMPKRESLVPQPVPPKCPYERRRKAEKQRQNPGLFE